ncbi:DNA breaking-rejoining enzyme [Gymnopus androsaceus JB14]|uniref:DNA breaking-rejoining enzyme n=1 Tax=Gymnopus androsaceus JB14 TaxID=1447944 RepID=A0A6A4HQT4_9AGAR|nr:DNA breaking-rejoining enzyme [Gymnopus androsaceus JB14]
MESSCSFAPSQNAQRPTSKKKILPSPFRPWVPADRRVLLWTTPYSLTSQLAHDIEVSSRLQTIMYKNLLSSTVPDTRQVKQAYGAGLLCFNQFCNAEGIPESSRMPASATLLGAFVANYTGTGTGKMIRNWLNSLQLCHLFNDAEWHGREGWLPALTKSADQKGVIFKQAPQGPITEKHLLTLRSSLDLTSTCHAAIWATALVAFWGCRRLGELLITSSNKFTIEHNVTWSTHISCSKVNGHRVISFHTPWTKTTGILGSKCLLTETFDNLCPVWAFKNHLSINHSPTATEPLFSYRNNTSWSNLLKSHFLHFTGPIFKQANLENVFGHSYRIGGSLKLLLDGVAPEIIMKLGGWTSLCFLIYWQRLEKVLPAAITRAWASRIKDFASQNNINPNVDKLDIE